MVGVWKAYLYGARINDRMLKNGMFAALLSMWDRLLAYRINDLIKSLAESLSQTDLEPLLVAAREKGYLRREG